MMPAFVRRWIARHPRAWVLALALVLAGAQTAGLLHELSHGPGSLPGGPAASTLAEAGAAPAATSKSVGPLHLGAAGDCLTCLALAALGGAAPAPVVAPLVAASPAAPWSPPVRTAFHPRLLRAYASRAPPSPACA